jgi:hypothetical protein
MSESAAPMKRSEQLAIDNIKRIADHLRGERNDALALAQELRERLEEALRLLAEARKQLPAGETAGRIDEFLGREKP